MLGSRPVHVVEVFALRHELQRQGRPSDGPAYGPRGRATDMRVADAHLDERAARGRDALGQQLPH